MKKLTEEQFNALNADEWVVTNLRYTLSGFKRQTTTKQNDIVFDIYDKLTDSKNFRNYSCPQCLYKAYSTVAKAYFAYTPTVEQSDEETTTVTEPKKPASKTVKKSTAKKKSTKTKRTKSEK